MFIKAAVVLLVCILPSSLHGGLLEDRFYTGEDPGAAAHGRGGLSAVFMSGGYSPVWNPAALASLRDNYMALSLNVVDTESEKLPEYLDMYRKGNLAFAGIAGPEVGLYWRYLSSVRDKETKVLDGDDFSLSRDIRLNLLGLSIGVQHAEQMDFGMNINLLMGTVGIGRIHGTDLLAEVPFGYGWSIDWGYLYHMTDNLRAGFMLRNAPGFMYWDKGYGRDRLPVSFKGGVNMSLTELMNLGLEYEKWFSDGSIDPGESAHIGIEHNLTENLIIRAGIYGKNLNKETENVYTAGIGYYQDSYRIDMAIRQYGAEDYPARRFSLSAEIPL